MLGKRPREEKASLLPAEESPSWKGHRHICQDAGCELSYFTRDVYIRESQSLFELSTKIAFVLFADFSSRFNYGPCSQVNALYSCFFFFSSFGVFSRQNFPLFQKAVIMSRNCQ